MKTRKLLLSGALALLVAVVGCQDLTAPNENNPPISQLTENPTRATVNSAAQGLMITSRANYNGAAGLVSSLGIVGRVSYNLDTADPRWASEMLAGAFTPNGFGDFMWDAPYRSIRNANTILNAVDAIPTAPAAQGGFTAEEKEALRGFTKTIQALDFLGVIVTRDDLGAPIDVGVDIDAEPAPFEDKQTVYGHIETLLDEAQGHLQAAGGSFPFELSSGFAGFATPATFLEFNRALAARVDVYMAGEFGLMGKYTEALGNLGDSFLQRVSTSPGATVSLDDLQLGVYHAFSGGSGDQSNTLFQPGQGPNLRAHPSVVDSAETQPGGEALDARVIRKTRDVGFADFGGAVAGSSTAFNLYDGVDAPIPVIRAEELILLRAEANIGLGNLGPAEDDINMIRDVSGQLSDDLDFADGQEALDQLLYEKRYSLMYEGGHHWIDMRRYDRLDALPLDLPSHIVHENWIIPGDECSARPGLEAC